MDGSEVVWNAGFNEKKIDLLHETVFLEGFYECTNANLSTIKRLEGSGRSKISFLAQRLATLFERAFPSNIFADSGIEAFTFLLDNFYEHHNSSQNECMFGLIEPLFEIMLSSFEEKRLHVDFLSSDDSFFTKLLGDTHNFNLHFKR